MILDLYQPACACGFVNRHDNCDVSAPHFTRHGGLAAAEYAFREVVHLRGLLINPWIVQRPFACLANAAVVIERAASHFKPAFAAFSLKVVTLPIEARRSFARRAVGEVQGELDCLLSLIKEVRS